MSVKKKLSAIFAILMMITSFFAVVQFPTQAQPPIPMVAPRDMTFKDPGTGLPIPSPGTLPMNLTYQHIVNATLLGKLLIVGIYLVPPAGGVNLSSYKVGFTFNPAVLRVATGGVYNVTPGAPLPPTVFEAAGKPFTTSPGSILNYWGNVTSYNVTLTTPGDYVTVGLPTPLLYVIFIVNYYGESNIAFTTNPWATQTALADQNGPIAFFTSDGYFKYGIHEVSISPGLAPWKGDPPNSIGDNITVTVSIKNTEPIHSWEINISYNPAVLSVPSPALVVEGSYFKMLLINDTFTPTVDNTAGWIHVNCTALPGQNRTGDGLLMVFVAYMVGYGVSPLVITSFSAVDNYGNPIPNLEIVSSGFQFEKTPILSLVDPGTGAPISKSWTTVNHTIGETFNVVLQLVDTSQLVSSWKAGFSFNPRVLQVVSVTDMGYLPNSTWTAGVINNTAGIVTSFNSTAAPGNYSTGGGALALITFKVIDYGLSHITLTDLDGDPTEAKLIDTAGNEIATPSGLVFTDHDYPNPGDDTVEFEFRAPITIEITAGSSKIWYPLTVPGETFTMNITISTMENITGWNIGFSFDPTVLEVLSVTEGPFLSSVATTEFQPGVIDNIAGIVTPFAAWFKFPGNWTKGNGTLAVITFRVKDYGDSNIVLTETVIVDPDGEECTVNTIDGYVFAKLPGDVNGDRVVDSTDYGIFGVAWPPGPYNPDCDFNADSVIDSTDYGLLGVNWGQSY